jgi:hypothetical protein
MVNSLRPLTADELSGKEKVKKKEEIQNKQTKNCFVNGGMDGACKKKQS